MAGPPGASCARHHIVTASDHDSTCISLWDIHHSLDMTLFRLGYCLGPINRRRTSSNRLLSSSRSTDGAETNVKRLIVATWAVDRMLAVNMCLSKRRNAWQFSRLVDRSAGIRFIAISIAYMAQCPSPEASHSCHSSPGSRNSMTSLVEDGDLEGKDGTTLICASDEGRGGGVEAGEIV